MLWFQLETVDENLRLGLKMTINKKSVFFVTSLWNLVKMTTSLNRQYWPNFIKICLKLEIFCKWSIVSPVANFRQQSVDRYHSNIIIPNNLVLSYQLFTNKILARLVITYIFCQIRTLLCSWRSKVYKLSNFMLNLPIYIHICNFFFSHFMAHRFQSGHLFNFVG